MSALYLSLATAYISALTFLLQETIYIRVCMRIYTHTHTRVYVHLSASLILLNGWAYMCTHTPAVSKEPWLLVTAAVSENQKTFRRELPFARINYPPSVFCLFIARVEAPYRRFIVVSRENLGYVVLHAEAQFVGQISSNNGNSVGPTALGRSQSHFLNWA